MDAEAAEGLALRGQQSQDDLQTITIPSPRALPDNVGVSISWLFGPAIANNAGGIRGNAIFLVRNGANGVFVQQTTIGKEPTYWEGWTVKGVVELVIPN